MNNKRSLVLDINNATNNKSLSITGTKDDVLSTGFIGSGTINESQQEFKNYCVNLL
jgi:hypothetical protein